MTFMRVPKVRFLAVYVLSSALVCWGQQGLRLEANMGDGAFNDVGRNEIGAVVVVVRDSSDRPVAGAKVTFTLPFSGPGAIFTDGSRSMTTTSDQAGLAKMSAAKPNKEEGRFNIRVAASADGGRSGNLVVSQSNTTALAAKSKTSKTLLILSLVGGGATAAIFAAKSGGKSTASPGVPGSPGSTSLSVGVLTVGAPR